MASTIFFETVSRESIISILLSIAIIDIHIYSIIYNRIGLWRYGPHQRTKMNPLQAKGNLNHLGKIGKNDRINPLSSFIFSDFEQQFQDIPHNGKVTYTIHLLRNQNRCMYVWNFFKSKISDWNLLKEISIQIFSPFF